MNVTEKILEKWQILQERMRQSKQAEAELRNKICMHLAGNRAKGTYNFDYDNLKAKVSIKENVKIDQEEMESTYDELSAKERMCIKITYELKMREYNWLPEAERRELDEMIIVTPATPTLEVKYYE